MKYFKILKYWWWYNIIVSKNIDHDIMNYETYYFGKGWWLLDSKYMSRKMRCKFRLCQKIFKDKHDSI